MNPDRLQKFLSNITKEESTGCWTWNGSRANGYGYFYMDGSNRRAHRIAYEHYKGPIPDGLQLDHTCCNKLCVNPDHLEPVTNQENCRRYWNAQETCRNGHPRSFMKVLSNGENRCALCQRIVNITAPSRRVAGLRASDIAELETLKPTP